MTVINRYGTKHTQETVTMASTLVSDVIKATKLQPRPYQFRIVQKGLDMFRGRYKNGTGQLELNARSVLIESPTGSGKTCMGWMLAKCLQEELALDGHDLVVGWVAMRRNLLSQAEGENRGKGINVRNAHMVSMFDKNPEPLLEAKRQGKKILLVVDEAQHDAASSMAHLHNELEPKFILGLSATPFRTDRVKLCFDKVIKDAGIHQLIQDGFLSKYHHYTIPAWTPEVVTETYLREPKRWGKSAMYFVNLEQCFAAQRILRAAGVVCDVVTGDTDIESQLEAFRNGDIPVLINCMKLTEGWDEPSLQTAFIRDSGKGPTMQMGGRVFRKFEGLPFKQIVQSKQTRWPLLRTAMPEQQYIWQENTWLSLTVNPFLNRINQNARMAIAQAEVELPTFLTRAKRRPRRLRF
jgi:superfamily II DNA or RNA helicase